MVSQYPSKRSTKKEAGTSVLDRSERAHDHANKYLWRNIKAFGRRTERVSVDSGGRTAPPPASRLTMVALWRKLARARWPRTVTLLVLGFVKVRNP